MPLTDTIIRSLTPGPKPIKKADEKGLFLLVQPSGGKLWRLKYRIEGKEKKLGLGRYPDVSLKEARKRRDEARQKLADGIDPGEEKRATPTKGRQSKARVQIFEHRYLSFSRPRALDRVKHEGNVNDSITAIPLPSRCQFSLFYQTIKFLRRIKRR